MSKFTALVGLVLVGWLAVFVAGPGADDGLPTPTVAGISSAKAAIGRGGSSGEGGQTQVGSRTASLLSKELTPVFFVVVGIALGVAVFQRNAGAAVAILVAAVVVGAFLLAPDQVESLYRTIYSFVL